MKKILRSLFCFALVTTLLFSVGCSQKSTLSFGNYFNGGANAQVQPGFTEICKYDVTFKKANDFASSAIEDCNFKDGEFTTTLNILSGYDGSLPETELYSVGSIVYEFITELKIKAVYTVKGEQKEYLDTVKTTSYFLDKDSSFAPLYSVSERHEGNPFSDGEVYDDITSYISYGKSSFEISGATSAKADYSFRTLIDNAELLFAIRNLDYTETITYIPVLTPAYKKATTLQLTIESDETKTYNLIFNDEANEYSYKIRNGYFAVDNSKASGKAHYFTIQKAGGEGDYRSLLTYYTEPLTADLGGFVPVYFGDLQYTLTDVTAN